jgi:hypothetical protein
MEIGDRRAYVEDFVQLAEIIEFDPVRVLR